MVGWCNLGVTNKELGSEVKTMFMDVIWTKRVINGGSNLVLERNSRFIHLSIFESGG